MKQIIPFKNELLFKTKVSEITSISLEHTLTLKKDDLISGEFLITGDYKMTEGSINREKFSFKIPFDIALDSRYDLSSIIIDIDNFYYEIVNNESLQVNIDVYVEGEKIQEVEEEKPILSKSSKEIKENTRMDLEGEHLEEKVENQKCESDELNRSSFSEDETSSQEEGVRTNTETVDHDQLEEEKRFHLLEKKNMEKIKDEPLEESIHYQNPVLTELEKENKINNIKNNEFNIFENIDNSDTYVTYYVYIVKESDNIDKITEKYGVTKEEISLYNNLDEMKAGVKLIIPNKHE